jgi:hypothetical protein
MEQKIKHLEFIQQIIERMAKNSFLLKGWSLTLSLAIISLSKATGNLSLSIIIFLLLDTYFLCQEKEFINLYNQVRKGKVKNFKIETSCTCKNFFGALFSIPNLIFYTSVLVIIHLTI